MDDLRTRLRGWQTVYPCDAEKPEGHLYEEAAARIEALEAQLGKADALADEMERLIRRTPFVPAPNGISLTIGLEQIADQKAALIEYHAAREKE
jgi:hypothetical protein